MSEVEGIKQLDSFLDGSEWPACQVQKGIETNLFFAKAGEKFTLSPETLALEYDYIRELVLKDVMDLLSPAGVVSPEGDNIFFETSTWVWAQDTKNC